MSDPIGTLPSELISAIFQILDYEAPQKLGRVHPFMDETFKKELINIAGPKCDAKIVIKNKDVTLTVKSTDLSEETSREVPLEEWRIVFENADCANFEIQTDEELSMDLLNQILIAKSINILQYSGKTITKEILDRLNDATGFRLEVEVEKWTPGMAGTRKMGSLNVLVPLGDLEDVVEVMKTVPDVYLEVTWLALLGSADVLQQLSNVELISEWHFNIHGHIGYYPRKVICQEFEEMVQTCFKDVVHFIDHKSDDITFSVFLIANTSDDEWDYNY
ncbi:unnamed protein product [Caenorhabditis angaria]|uniref:Uncharacterized protein n=1 Tax=Caenorhabditis angaria TaxID=860376 RepID=A0A9P1IXL1_9PELO|nr:unnamed protein product [Caenorhabditis angaria]